MKTRLRLLLSSAALTVVSTTAMALPADGSFGSCSNSDMGAAYVAAYSYCTGQGASNASITSCTANSYGTVVFGMSCRF